ncbi:hypothetical protein [Streptomyces aurantiogriseus]|uniref:Uncharacterized protein n=1 Tax=Streptomyces aurantiogriseus TaxID=66870 RepID=A0A918EZX4_9ACTN|nr:hypothetical protein [Streptomyces aurantiogriseus]GGQ91851.1 hypothetical protein GCM10010251_03020 [Streptomyces aurantiogriseus]
MYARLWFLVPASGLAAVWLALYERTPAKEPQFYILCRTPGSLTAVSWGVALCIVGAAAVSVVGAVRAVRTPSRRPLRPVLHLTVTLVLAVGADGLDSLGSRIAYRTAVSERGADHDACEYGYHVTPGWLFFVPPEVRDQWADASTRQRAAPGVHATATASPTDTFPGRSTAKYAPKAIPSGSLR